MADSLRNWLTRNHSKQFSLLTLLTIVAVIAILMLPVSQYVRHWMQRPESFSGVMLEIGVKDLRVEDKNRLDADSLYYSVLRVPHVINLAPVRESRDAKSWLKRHLLIRQVDGNVIEVLSYGRRNERLSVNELRTLRQAAINAVRAEATNAGASVSVIGEWNASPTR